MKIILLGLQGSDDLIKYITDKNQQVSLKNYMKTLEGKKWNRGFPFSTCTRGTLRATKYILKRAHI